MRYSNQQQKSLHDTGHIPLGHAELGNFCTLSGLHSVRIPEPAASSAIPPRPDSALASGCFVGPSVRIFSVKRSGLNAKNHSIRPDFGSGCHPNFPGSYGSPERRREEEVGQVDPYVDLDHKAETERAAVAFLLHQALQMAPSQLSRAHAIEKRFHLYAPIPKASSDSRSGRSRVEYRDCR
jgi:hypothetical protein